MYVCVCVCNKVMLIAQGYRDSFTIHLYCPSLQADQLDSLQCPHEADV